jgi:excisionase family DNA binding protein
MNQNELILLSRAQVEQIVLDALKAAISQHLPAQVSTAPALPSVMTIDQVSEYTGISKDAIYRKTGAGLIPHSKQGKRLYFDRGQIDAWLMSNSIHPDKINERAAQYLQRRKRA